MKHTILPACALLLACAGPALGAGMDLAGRSSELLQGQRPLDADMGWKTTLDGSGRASLSDELGAEPFNHRDAAEELYQTYMLEEREELDRRLGSSGDMNRGGSWPLNSPALRQGR
ncbi:MAG: hypothetical protein PUB01_02415 [Desulfovibrionaceae bacterium]|nr:hypothetical protein [Desulfovibrionaceae bacterium]